MKIVVTGASGFIGSHLTQELAHDHDLLAISRSKVDANFSSINSDINDIATLGGEYDVFIHAAGQAHIQQNEETRELFIRNNVQATKNALQLAHQSNVKHFVLISSLSSLSDDETDIYASTKRESESLTIEFCNNNDMRYTTIRPAMVYGENDTKGNMNRLINQINKGFFPLFNSGNTIKNMVYVQNLVFIIKTVLLNQDYYSKTITARDTETLNLKAICQEIRRAIDRRVFLIPAPRFASLMLIQMVALSQKLGVARSLNIRSIKNLLVDENFPHENFKLPYSSSEGIHKTVRHALK